jgi:hypothetical protein
VSPEAVEIDRACRYADGTHPQLASAVGRREIAAAPSLPVTSALPAAALDFLRGFKTAYDKVGIEGGAGLRRMAC